jgi:hypothetical protein
MGRQRRDGRREITNNMKPRFRGGKVGEKTKAGGAERIAQSRHVS